MNLINNTALKADELLPPGTSCKPSVVGASLLLCMKKKNVIEDLQNGKVTIDGVIISGLVQIPEFPHHYINKEGIIYSASFRIIRKVVVDFHGYGTLNMRKDGKYHCKKIHRILAELFIPNPENKCCINHINGIRHDNRLENLEWVTHGENIQHSYDYLGRKAPMSMLGMRGEKSPYSHIICQLSLDGFLIEVFHGIREAVRQTGIPKTSISKCRDGVLKHAGGYLWR